MKLITRAFKFRLYPSRAQERQLRHYSAVAKWTWNWAVRTARNEEEKALQECGYLGECPEDLKDKTVRWQWQKDVSDARRFAKRDKVKLPYTYSVGFLGAKFKQDVLDNPDHPSHAWVRRAHSHVYGSSTVWDRFQKAHKDFIAWLSSGRPMTGGRKKGPPRFKPKWHHSSFTMQFKVKPAKMAGGIPLPQPLKDGLPSHQRKIRCRPSPQTQIETGEVAFLTVRPVADYWEATITVKEVQRALLPRKTSTIGVDLGLNSIITIAEDDGIARVAPPRCLDKKLKKLARLQRAHSRKQTGSKRHEQSRLKVARLHAKIANQRYDFLQQLSHRLVRDHNTVAVEGFNVHSLVETGVDGTNKRKAATRRAIVDVSWGELRRQLDYKCAWNDRNLLVGLTPNREHDPTDQQCCDCGVLNKMPPSTNKYRCTSCGASRTRQENTALLLKSFGEGHLPESTPGDGETNGRGDDGSAARHPASLKRETSSF
jgi:IS605 OrfB family transposase